MKIEINNGSQIGGAVTKITGENGSIIIDFGEALPGYDATPEWDSVKENVKGVLFTHNHGDHFAKFSSIPTEIPLYMSKVMGKTELITLEKLIALCNKKMGGYTEKDKKKFQKAEKRLENNVILFKENKEFQIGDFVITPYSVDHSVYDAYMFLVQSHGETLLHTGDFRTNGWRGKSFSPLLKTIVKKAGHIDYLITEGTNITRNVPVFTEYDLSINVDRLFDKHKKVFLLAGGTNMDTLATYINSANRHKMVTVCNSRVKAILELFGKTAGEYSKCYKFEKVFPFMPEEILPKVNITQEEYMHQKGFLAITGYRDYNLEFIEKFKYDKEKPVIVYAMWKGYIEDPKNPAYNKEMADFLDRCEALGFKVLKDGYHTSGHASREAIEQLINITNPQKAIYPIHTDSPQAFESLNIPQELKGRIVWF